MRTGLYTGLAFIFIVFCAGSSGLPLVSKTMINPAAYIPPQCYTKTDDDHNPCYTCHRDSIEPNYNNDVDLQKNYEFPEFAMKNRWSNLFKDRTAELAKMSDEEILEYVRQDNYPELAERLRSVPAEWDFNSDGKWSGYAPDCFFRFDREGFDVSPDGQYSGWRAFAYAPLPGAFWPTNGSADDVLIRLSAPFCQDSNGRFSKEIYKINLAIVEALIKRADVKIDPADERLLGVDLDKDGRLGEASVVRYDWSPKQGRHMSYVGMAKQLMKETRLHLAAGLFPEGTEFLHSVRYLDVKNGEVAMAPRMKELRYARKTAWLTYSSLDSLAYAEKKETHDFPDRLSQFQGNIEHGLGNGQGWTYQGFIEDRNGRLRPQTYEETVFCMGCHSGLGATTDSIFTYSRKYDEPEGGWFHWTRHGLKNMPEQMSSSDGKGLKPEYAAYLENNRAGDEFRENKEVIGKFFDQEGHVGSGMKDKLKSDISVLLLPTSERALTLDKAYRIIVKEQSFIYGRDATATPPENVYKEIN